MRAASTVALLLLAGCASPAPAPDPSVVLEPASAYRSFERVNTDPNWAPTLCSDPTPRPAPSASRDPETHGRKLYYLFAKDAGAYRRVQEMPQPVGQVLVKESWVPKGGIDAKRRVPGERGPLFLMIKTGGPDTDEGWIYATTTPDGKTITSSGKLASCMECHQSGTKDRLFGLRSCASPD